MGRVKNTQYIAIWDCCTWPCFSKDMGPDGLQRSLPTTTVLWFHGTMCTQLLCMCKCEPCTQKWMHSNIILYPYSRVTLPAFIFIWQKDENNQTIQTIPQSKIRSFKPMNQSLTLLTGEDASVYCCSQADNVGYAHWLIIWHAIYSYFYWACCFHSESHNPSTKLSIDSQASCQLSWEQKEFTNLMWQNSDNFLLFSFQIQGMTALPPEIERPYKTEPVICSSSSCLGCNLFLTLLFAVHIIASTIGNTGPFV